MYMVITKNSPIHINHVDVPDEVVAVEFVFFFFELTPCVIKGFEKLHFEQGGKCPSNS